ncbi:MAG: rod shape-determining protein RodA [Armatimonadota bacterium]|nr:rod shape-determining protein RodA [Armatimonadota bacterium]MDW8290137.1 rod shape-determining protein RodA [Armatimonadota bacterium]
MRKYLRELDWTTIAIALLLCAVGLVAIYSARRAQGDSVLFVRKQAIAMSIGVAAMLVVAYFPIHWWQRWTRLLYVVNIGLLVYVDFFGKVTKGSQRWIPLPGGFHLQPSELAKLFVILTLAAWLASREEKVRSPRTLVQSLAYIGLPVLLIFKQPDLGTSLVVMAIWFGMMLLAGANFKHLGAVLAIGALAFVALWHLNILEEYQKSRLIAFLDPQRDPRGSGYQIIQARIAVGSGQVFGKGLFQGTQNELLFIPEQHTDFIFTVIAEETGFVGSVALLSAYALLLWRFLRLILQAHRAYARLIAAGITTFFAYHIIVNTGMVIGILPVVGVWLPFVSFGGTAVITCFLAIGFMQAIHRQQHEVMF